MTRRRMIRMRFFVQEYSMRTIVRNARFWTAMAALLLACGASGCSLGEAMVDGVYGGVSDTVSGAIADTLLGALRLNGR